jgi:hypothetical protein
MQITSGKIEGAKKVLIYGPEGVGKSTLAAMFPGALFIDVEGSTKELDVKRLPHPESWTALMEEVAYVRLNPTSCRTLIIDTADWAEKLCIAHVCAIHQTDSIEKILGGYGKGYTVVGDEFGNLLNLLSEVADRGVHVVLTAHANVRKFEQPDEMAAYDRWGLKLTNTKAGNGSASMTREWADAVLFATYKTFAVKNETKTAKAQGGKHVLYTSHHPAYDAKNRWNLPEEIDIEGITTLPPVLAAVLASAPAPVAPAAPVQSAASVIEEMGATAVEELPAVIKEQPPLPSGTVPAHLVALHQLMESGGATEEDVRKVVALKGYFPLVTPIETYPVDFVEGVLIGAWPQVLEAINAAKQPNLGTPFDK